jgi:dynein light intermediate chain 1
MLVVILLDWGQPWTWIRQLQSWIQLLRYLLVSLDDNCKEVMEEVMVSWRDRGRGGNGFDGNLGGAVLNEEDVSLPLGPGEWDEALGIPICVVCQNVSWMIVRL